MPVDVVQVDNVDHISECFRNMCTDWFDVNSIKHKASVNECFTDLCFDKLNVETSKHDFLCQKKMYWKDHLHYGIKHNTDAFNYHDFDSYSVDMITEFVAEQGVSAIEMMTPQQDLIAFETVDYLVEEECETLVLDLHKSSYMYICGKNDVHNLFDYCKLTITWP